MEETIESLRPGTLVSMREIAALLFFSGSMLVLLCLAGCASNPNSDVLVDPLKQRLIAREDIALQNLLVARVPAYSGGGYFDEPYDGPVVEPPLPDLSLLPEDLPPWEDVSQTAGAAEATPEQPLLEPLPEGPESAATPNPEDAPPDQP